MTPGARPHDLENPGRVEQVAEFLKKAERRGCIMQQSRAGSLVTGDPFGTPWNTQMKNIDNEWFKRRCANEAGLGLLLLYR
jgi:hypothetical protein